MPTQAFVNGSSRIHRLEPRYRVVAAAWFSIVVALSNQWPTLIAAAVTALWLLRLAELDIRRVVLHLKAAFAFMALVWLVLPVSFEGPAVFSIGPLDMTNLGLAASARITIKSLSILSALVALIATMTPAALGHALGRLRLSPKLVLLLLMTYRYIFVIEAEYRRLRTALKVRGFKPRTNLHSYKTIAYLVGMIFVRAHRRAQRVNRAMICRGFKGTPPPPIEIGNYTRDRLLLLPIAAAAVLLVLMEIWSRTSA